MATTALHAYEQVQQLWLAQRSFLFLKVVYEHCLHFHFDISMPLSSSSSSVPHLPVKCSVP